MIVDTNDRDFWRCAAGSAFGLALAVIGYWQGFSAFLVAALLGIVGGLAAWFFGRIFA